MYEDRTKILTHKFTKNISYIIDWCFHKHNCFVLFHFA